MFFVSKYVFRIWVFEERERRTRFLLFKETKLLRFCSKSFFGIAIFINGELQEEKEEGETIYKKRPRSSGVFGFGLLIPNQTF